METRVAIESRRSIRKFKQDKIDIKTIKDILNCGRLAPSSKNRQPWQFVVITNKKLINDIADIMIDNHTKEIDIYDEKYLKAKNSVLPTANILKQVPVVIFVFQPINENWKVGDNLSIGACIENMCLRAVELNLGSLWVRDIVYAQDIITKHIKFDNKNLILNSALLLGVANENPKARPRNKLSDITTWIK